MGSSSSKSKSSGRKSIRQSQDAQLSAHLASLSTYKNQPTYLPPSRGHNGIRGATTSVANNNFDLLDDRTTIVHDERVPLAPRSKRATNTAKPGHFQYRSHQQLAPSSQFNSTANGSVLPPPHATNHMLNNVHHQQHKRQYKSQQRLVHAPNVVPQHDVAHEHVMPSGAAVKQTHKRKFWRHNQKPKTSSVITATAGTHNLGLESRFAGYYDKVVDDYIPDASIGFEDNDSGSPSGPQSLSDGEESHYHEVFLYEQLGLNSGSVAAAPNGFCNSGNANNVVNGFTSSAKFGAAGTRQRQEQQHQRLEALAKGRWQLQQHRQRRQQSVGSTMALVPPAARGGRAFDSGRGVGKRAQPGWRRRRADQTDCCIDSCAVPECSCCSSTPSSCNVVGLEVSGRSPPRHNQYPYTAPRRTRYHIPSDTPCVLNNGDEADCGDQSWRVSDNDNDVQNDNEQILPIEETDATNNTTDRFSSVTNLHRNFQQNTFLSHLNHQHNFAKMANKITATTAPTVSSGDMNNHAQNGHQLTNKSLAQKLNSFEKGLAMNDEEREQAGMVGLLPAAYQSQELQSKAVMNFITTCQDELSKYVYLRNLKDFNERLFYFTLINNVEKLMPLVYTPTVGLGCQKFSEIYMRPRGLYVTAKDAGRVRQVLANWSEKNVRVIVVTDGERILGLGDLGANGMGISIGKLSLYTALAGIPPQNVLPVTIDVGTNNEAFLRSEFYIGLRQHRLRGEKYEQLIDEFMEAVVERWGRSCLIQFEDFGNSTAFDLLKRYRNNYCTFNDDIQGTASVSLSGLISAAKLIGKRLSDCSFLFYGAGEANLGTAQLLIMAMKDEGLSIQEAKRNIWLVDSKGLVVKSRTDLSEHKIGLAQEYEHLKNLEDVVDGLKPTAIIGASAQGGAFSESVCKKMASYNERPIIFALSNPTSKAECTAAQAYQWTNGKCVFASGSPFDPVELNGKTYISGQGNNAYIFPGVGLAAIGAHTHSVPEETFLVAARALSDQVTSEDTSVGLIYPRLPKIREVTLKVATRVLEYFYAERLATYRPEPNNKSEFLKTIQYNPSY